MKRHFGFLTAALALLAAYAGAHTLPISYLTLVPDENYVHAELTLNPFELSFFPEVDPNHNGFLDSAELTAHAELVTRKITDCIELRVEGRLVKAEVTGASLATDSHHLILRAHYPVHARRSGLSVAADLAALTRGGHLTVVNFVSGGRRQSAILDQDSRSASFAPTAASTGLQSLVRRAFFAVISLGPLLLLLAALGLAVVSKAGKVLLPVFVASQIAAAGATVFLSVSFASSLLLAIVALTVCYLALEMLISGHGSRPWLIVASGIAGVVYGVAAGMLAGGPDALPILDFLKYLLLFVVLQGPFYVAGLAISSYAAAFTSKRSFRLSLSSVLLAGGITFLVRLLVAS